jgi:hypothetical protein
VVYLGLELIAGVVDVEEESLDEVVSGELRNSHRTEVYCYRVLVWTGTPLRILPDLSSRTVRRT